MKFQSIFGASHFETEIQVNYSLLVQLITVKHLVQTSLFYLLILQRQTEIHKTEFGFEKGCVGKLRRFCGNLWELMKTFDF